jgi:hypothetical protein
MKMPGTPVRRLIAICLFALTITSMASAADTASARAFVERMYAAYADDSTSPAPLGADAPSLFAPKLLALIRDDQRRERGEVGLLDFDPICGCQDFQRLTVKAIHFQALAPGRLRATVNLVNDGQPKSIGFILVVQDGQWRIADVREPHVPSLVRFLRNGLGKAQQR